MSSHPLYMLLLTGAAAAWLPFADAFSFNIDTTPQQCGNLSISITGTGGTPPYRAMILPFGGSPLSNGVEPRKILDQPFAGDATSVSFQLSYPAFSQFVVVVSDSTNFGSGGTSSAASVVNSSDSSCFSTTTSVTPAFFYNLDPLNQIVQCTNSHIWWTPSDVHGAPTFYGVIPGGDAFNITYSNTSTLPNEGVGFDWVPPVRAGTTLIIGAGDDRGLGTGGSVTYFVSAGNQITSCLNSSSPSSTAGSPAGGSYPTSTSEAENNGSNSGGGTNAGAIAGGVVGGIVVISAFILTLFFLRRRRRFQRNQNEKPDLFMDNERPDGYTDELAPPEPFIVPPPPTVVSSETESSAVGTYYGYVGSRAGSSAGRRLSTVSTSAEGEHLLRPGTPMTSASGAGSSSAVGRKGGAPFALRPVNFIQHEDAGEPPEEDAEPDTIELPPAYTNLRQAK
ncbi:hypothetical protein EW145_g5368 [Phellinidium pouzarii]|uniref:Mid2 domain-containing protein n=1 Tax=Phellinidium pouzarii TaxID=167371 RepID=A0A4S4L508_9AGAM|nr:hypothetical protein EW145_g5368 [Phellinidium pouzarii]